MRGLGAALAVALLIAACGGDGSGDGAHTPKTVTSEFLALQEDAGYKEAVTPGSGGFIETPQRRASPRAKGLINRAPQVRHAPNGESVFGGFHRDVYLRARSTCARVPRRELARRAGVSSGDPFAIAASYALERPAFWQAGFEGCAVGIMSRSR